MDKQMIRIPTDATNLSTDCIGISSTPRSKKMRGRGRPKGSKSKTSRSSRHCRKRTATESHFEYTPNQTEPSLSPKLSPYDSPPRRKKRKPNKAHRDAFPDHTDEAIRRQLALERKAKNRKSAQESRERRKKQETYLNQRLPKGLALKALLQSNKLHSTLAESESDIDFDIDIENENLEAALSRDAELSEMKMILDEMCDNFASEYDEYPMAQRERNEISDELIIDILKEYVSADGVGRSEDELILETDRDAIHLQVIGEIENGVPMHVDDIPPSATPNAFKATRGRKLKRKQKQSVRLKTPPTIPYTHHFNVADTELPPPVFGNDNIDFNIGPESASGYNVESVPYPIPLQSELTSMYHQTRKDDDRHPAKPAAAAPPAIPQIPAHPSHPSASTAAQRTDAFHHQHKFDHLRALRAHKKRSGGELRGCHESPSSANESGAHHSARIALSLSPTPSPSLHNDTYTESSHGSLDLELAAPNDAASALSHVYDGAHCSLPAHAGTDAFHPPFAGARAPSAHLAHHPPLRTAGHPGDQANAHYAAGHPHGSSAYPYGYGYGYASQSQPQPQPQPQWQSDWKQWQEWQEFQEWKQFKQYKEWREGGRASNGAVGGGGGDAHIGAVGAGGSELYYHHLWHGHGGHGDGGHSGRKYKAAICGKDEGGEARVEQSGFGFYQDPVGPLRSERDDGKRDRGAVRAGDHKLHQTASFAAAAKGAQPQSQSQSAQADDGGCHLSLPSLSTDCNGDLAKYEATDDILSAQLQAMGHYDIDGDKEGDGGRGRGGGRFEGFECFGAGTGAGDEIDFIATGLFRGVSNESDHGLFAGAFEKI